MIILTGGAGFIGSCFLWKLNEQGIDNITIVDDLDGTGKRRNLTNKRYGDYIQKDEFLRLVEENKLLKPEFVIHMGACSSTLLNDEDHYIQNNYEYSKSLARWAFHYNVPFIYASSAATYGDGRFGYDDSDETTRKLKPLNYYGYYKYLFDLWILDSGFANKTTGLKFFNVFGPNEYHKGEMRSVICKRFPDVKDRGYIRLFKSYRDDYKDGEQRRDFIYIKDAVEVMYYFFKNSDRSGIFNVGTGEARTWNDLAYAMFAALGKEPKIEYVDMPEYLKSKYQYFTQAKIDKLRAAGYDLEFMALEDSVKDYIQYLQEGSYL